jgi:hypothetical protein
MDSNDRQHPEIRIFKKESVKPGVMVHACNPATEEIEVGES